MLMTAYNHDFYATISNLALQFYLRFSILSVSAAFLGVRRLGAALNPFLPYAPLLPRQVFLDARNHLA